MKERMSTLDAVESLQKDLLENRQSFESLLENVALRKQSRLRKIEKIKDREQGLRV